MAHKQTIYKDDKFYVKRVYGIHQGSVPRFQCISNSYMNETVRMPKVLRSREGDLHGGLQLLNAADHDLINFLDTVEPFTGGLFF